MSPVKAAPYRKQVECRNGWVLLQRKTHGMMLCRCGWKSKSVPLGKDPQAYSAKLDAVTKDHERKANHARVAPKSPGPIRDGLPVETRPLAPPTEAA